MRAQHKQETPRIEFMSLKVFSCYQLTNYTLRITTPAPKALWPAFIQVCLGPCWHLAGGRGNNRNFVVTVLVCVCQLLSFQESESQNQASFFLTTLSPPSPSSLSLTHPTRAPNLPTHLQTQRFCISGFPWVITG